MKISKSARFEPLFFLLIAALFISGGVKFENRMFIIWGIVSLFFTAAIFLIHKFSKRETENVYVPLFLLFAGCLVICAGLFEMRDKSLILIGGVFMAFGVLLGFLFSSEGRRIKDERLKNSIRMPSEYIVLFAVKESEENDDVKWYVIDKRTGIPHVFSESKYASTDFGTVRMLACSKYARCFMMDEMKKRSFWADFAEDNWWRKLKVKFDKTQSIDILQNKDESNAGSGTKLYLGTFSFTEEDNKRIRAACAKYLPSDTNTVEAQLRLQKSLEYVMNTAILEMKTELIWKVNEGATEEEKTRHFKTALVNTIMTVEELLEVLSTELLKRKVDQATSEELLKAWVTLEYYSYIIKPQYSMNIRHYRDYIHSVVKAKFDNPDQEGWGSPVRFEGTHICFDSKELIKWRNTHVLSPQYELHGALPLMMKEPVVTLFEDGTKTKEYILGTEGDEDFSGKYFLVSVRVSSHGDPAAFAVQIDGFISDTPEDRNITLKDIGYRFEVHFLACSAEASKERYKMLRGRDLDMKALKYQGYTTPTNVRLVGVCPECGKSFAFRGYAFYMAQDDVVYSDDGVDVCTVSAYDIDKDKVYEVEGKKFRYYNSFNCPHCLTPYIDYKKYPEMKKFGVSGCVHLGRKYYKASDM